MTWVKLDDNFADHPAIAPLSDAAFRLHVAALCYCARYLTDGLVPEAFVDSRRRKAAAELVSRGRWRTEVDGWRIHDYLDYQESREKVEARREKVKQRVSKHRNGVTNDVGNAIGNHAPVPSRPVSTYISSPSGRDRRPEPKPSESYAAQEAKRRAALEAEPSRDEAEAAFAGGLRDARIAAHSLKVVNE
jgi:hypothetical protein